MLIDSTQAARPMPAETARRRWIAPRLQKLDAGEARNGMSGTMSDGPISLGS